MRNPYKARLANLGLQYRPILGTASAKTIKGEKLGFLTAIVYLSPTTPSARWQGWQGAWGHACPLQGAVRLQSSNGNAKPRLTSSSKTSRHSCCRSLPTSGRLSARQQSVG